MANNVVMLSVDLGGTTWFRLTQTPIVANVTIKLATVGMASVPSSVSVRYGGESLCEWPPGSSFSFEGVDLSKFEFKCGSDTCVVAVGNTR